MFLDYVLHRTFLLGIVIFDKYTKDIFVTRKHGNGGQTDIL